MGTTTVRVSDKSQILLKELAKKEGVTMQSVIEKALEEYRRKKFLEELNVGYALEKEPLHDLCLWEHTLLDGLQENM